MKEITFDHLRDEIIPDSGIYLRRYDLRNGNVELSAKLLMAADDHQWDEVVKLLAQGADPRICLLSDGVYEISALFCALIDKKYDIADKLYDAGDRLDDLHVEGSEISDEILVVILNELRQGRNFLRDDSKPLSECVRRLQLAQCLEIAPHASPEELALSVKMLPGLLRRWNAPLYLGLLRLLKSYGADFSAEKQALNAMLETQTKWPRVMRPEPEILHQIEDFIKDL